MDQHLPPALSHLLATIPARRDVLRGLTAAGLGLMAPRWIDAKKKRKRKKKCAKAGKKTSRKRKKCCKGLVKDGAGRCAACDVCARGCRYASVQAAIDDAGGPGTIAICAGTFREQLTIGRDLTLIGAGDGAGAGDTLLTVPPPGMPTGDAIVTVPAGRTVSLERLRISGGAAVAQRGIVNQGTLTLSGCTISGNASSEITSAYCSGLGSCGGGIYNGAEATLTLDACHVTGNIAEDPQGFGYGIGGGIYNALGGMMTLQNGSTVTESTATVEGGGIFNSGVLTLLEGSGVHGNSSGSFGGGIENAGTLALIASDVTDNRASRGGGVYNGFGILTLLNGSSVTGNTATLPAPSGGGVYNDHATVDAVGGSITGNTPDNCVNDGGSGCPP